MGDTLSTVGGAIGDVGNWVYGAGSDVLGYLNQNPALANLASAGLMGGLSAITAGQNQSSANKYAQQALQTWQQTAYPQQGAVDAQAALNRGELGQARLSAYQNLGNTMAARGWGSGSGLGTKAAADIEKNYLATLGKQATELTKFKLTPQWGVPSQAYGYPTVSPLSAATSTTGSALSQAMGYMQMANMLKGLGGNKNTLPTNYNYYNPSTYYGGNIGGFDPIYGQTSGLYTNDIYSPFYMGGY